MTDRVDPAEPDPDDEIGADEPDDEPDDGEAGGADREFDDRHDTVAAVAHDTPRMPRGQRRVSRWDRPAPPHDWRYFVGLLGRTLIVIGILMFGFVGYQLWGTGIATARAQDRLENEFDQLVADARSTTTTSTTSTTTTTPSGTTTGTTTATPATTDAGTAVPATTEPEGSDDTSTSEPDEPTVTAPATSVVPVEQDIPPILPGKAIAKLEIPRMGKDGDDALLVVPGVDLDALQQGPGHYPDTPLPGQLGNAAIAGHRTTWGEPFARIDELQPGDEIIVTMLTGDRFVYEVATTEIVSPRDYYVVQTTDPTVAQLTLTSCHPRWSAKQRIAVHAFLVSDESAPVGTPTYYDLEANDADRSDASADDPALTLPDDTAPVTSAPDDQSTVDREPTETTETDETADEAAVGAPDGPDALTAGWFHDSEAWPQIALWGAICAAIAVLAYRISKRFKNYAIGWSLAITPFVVALYFLYQNVNRLLPPGL